MNKYKVNVVKLMFGDWGENYVCDCEWDYFNEWYGIKDKVDSVMSVGLWNSEVCGSKDENVDVKEIVNRVEFNRFDDYVIEVRSEKYDEFSYMYFNVDKIGDKIIKIDFDNKSIEILDNVDDLVYVWEGIECNGESDSKYDIVSDESFSYFKLNKDN